MADLMERLSELEQEFEYLPAGITEKAIKYLDISTGFYLGRVIPEENFGYHLEYLRESMYKPADLYGKTFKNILESSIKKSPIMVSLLERTAANVRYFIPGISETTLSLAKQAMATATDSAEKISSKMDSIMGQFTEIQEEYVCLSSLCEAAKIHLQNEGEACKKVMEVNSKLLEAIKEKGLLTEN